MNSYQAFYKGKKIEVHADTSYKAQLKAAEVFQLSQSKLVKSYDITVVLCEVNGEQVTHVVVD
jgi:hypothetical protein